MGDLSELRHFRVIQRVLLASYAAVAEFCEELEPPARDLEVVAVAPVRVVEVEDRLESFRGSACEPFDGDVVPVVGVGGDDVDALRSKGTSTTFAYRPSASSATVMAASRSDMR
jgi:hypothetical protein